MPDLVKIDLEPIVQKLNDVLSRFPGVAGAFLFGSVLGSCRPDSDIDVGLVLAPGIPLDSEEADRLLAEIACALSPIGNHPFDVTVLSPEDTIFAFRVISEGRLIYHKDYEYVTDLIEHVSRRYADIYPRYKKALEQIMNDLASAPVEPKEGGSLWE